jgi:hypothetical protein
VGLVAAGQEVDAGDDPGGARPFHEVGVEGPHEPLHVVEWLAVSRPEAGGVGVVVGGADDHLDLDVDERHRGTTVGSVDPAHGLELAVEGRGHPRGKLGRGETAESQGGLRGAVPVVGRAQPAVGQVELHGLAVGRGRGGHVGDVVPEVSQLLGGGREIHPVGVRAGERIVHVPDLGLQHLRPSGGQLGQLGAYQVADAGQVVVGDEDVHLGGDGHVHHPVVGEGVVVEPDEILAGPARGRALTVLVAHLPAGAGAVALRGRGDLRRLGARPGARHGGDHEVIGAPVDEPREDGGRGDHVQPDGAGKGGVSRRRHARNGRAVHHVRGRSGGWAPVQGHGPVCRKRREQDRRRWRSRRRRRSRSRSRARGRRSRIGSARAENGGHEDRAHGEAIASRSRHGFLSQYGTLIPRRRSGQGVSED